MGRNLGPEKVSNLPEASQSSGNSSLEVQPIPCPVVLTTFTFCTIFSRPWKYPLLPMGILKSPREEGCSLCTQRRQGTLATHYLVLLLRSWATMEPTVGMRNLPTQRMRVACCSRSHIQSRKFFLGPNLLLISKNGLFSLISLPHLFPSTSDQSHWTLTLEVTFS